MIDYVQSLPDESMHKKSDKGISYQMSEKARAFKI
jgi:hypothetical protein